MKGLSPARQGQGQPSHRVRAVVLQVFLEGLGGGGKPVLDTPMAFWPIPCVPDACSGVSPCPRCCSQDRGGLRGFSCRSALAVPVRTVVSEVSGQDLRPTGAGGRWE